MTPPGLLTGAGPLGKTRLLAELRTRAEARDHHPAESGYIWVFAMGGTGAAVLLLASAASPGRRSLS